MTKRIEILQRRLECFSRDLKVPWIALKVFWMYSEETVVRCSAVNRHYHRREVRSLASIYVDAALMVKKLRAEQL